MVAIQPFVSHHFLCMRRMSTGGPLLAMLGVIMLPLLPVCLLNPEATQDAVSTGDPPLALLGFIVLPV